MVSILLWIQISELEGKLVFNGGSNREAASMGNEMLMLHHSFRACAWPGPGLEIQKYTKTINGKLLSQQSLMIEHNSIHLSLLLLECNTGKLEGLTSLVKTLENIDSQLRRSRDSQHSFSHSYFDVF